MEVSKVVVTRRQACATTGKLQQQWRQAPVQEAGIRLPERTMKYYCPDIRAEQLDDV